MRSRFICLLAILFFFEAAAFAGQTSPVVPIYDHISGDLREVSIEPGDTLYAISARHGVSVANIMRENAISDARKIRAGKTLTINTRRVIPEATDNGLVADITSGTLYRFEGARLLSRYPAGFGTTVRPTPIGTFIVLFVDENTDWDYPASVDEEREREASIATTRRPPAPPVTLGPRWIQLSTWGFGIHATPFPSTIGSYMSYQHIRVGKEEMKELASIAGSGMRLESIYQPVRLALPPDGTVWLEAHEDVYGLGEPAIDDVITALGDRAEDVDRDLIARVLLEKSGVAELVGKDGEAVGMVTDGANGALAAEAEWSCLDCPPGESRRVSLQLKAKRPLTLESAFPLNVLNASGQPVYNSSPGGEKISLKAGETRNFVWDLITSKGQAVPPGQYTVLISFTPEGE